MASGWSEDTMKQVTKLEKRRGVRPIIRTDIWTFVGQLRLLSHFPSATVRVQPICQSLWKIYDLSFITSPLSQKSVSLKNSLTVAFGSFNNFRGSGTSQDFKIKAQTNGHFCNSRVLKSRESSSHSILTTLQVVKVVDENQAGRELSWKHLFLFDNIMSFIFL